MYFSSIRRLAFSVDLSILLLLLLGCQNSTHKPFLPAKEVVLKLTPSRTNPRNSEGDFIRLQDGRLLFVYTHFTGGWADEAHAYLAGRFSSDGGKTWTKEDTLILPNEARQNIMSVSLLRLNPHKIALFYLRKNSSVDCVPVVRFSTDEARTWGPPTVCVPRPGYFVLNNDRAVRLKTGRILLPLALHNTPETHHFGNGRLFCALSDNEGRIWRLSQEVPNPNHVTTQEPGVVELKNGKLLLFCRTDRGSQYISFSHDRGETWQPLKPSRIRSPLAPASIERIPKTGDLLLVWNDTYNPHAAGGGDRTPLNLAISRDEGNTWEKIKTLEADPLGWYCYTAIDFENDHVLLAYCAGDRRKESGLATTHITRLSLDWVYAEATPDPQIKSDSTGTVRLQDALVHARIRYSLDPQQRPQDYRFYKNPLHLSYPARVSAWAKGPDRPLSRLRSVFVGKHLLVRATHPADSLLPGLAATLVRGEFSSVTQLDTARFGERIVLLRASLDDLHVSENFGLVARGFLRAPQTGFVVLSLLSNDGSVWTLDDSIRLENDFPHGDREVFFPLTLAKGWHKINLRYFQQKGGKRLRLFWKWSGQEKEEIPPRFWAHVKEQERP